MRKARFVFYTVLSMLALGVSAYAQNGGPNGHSAFVDFAPLAVGIAAGVAGLGDGLAIAGACEATARNPSAGGRIFTLMILGLALIETLVLFTFLTVVLYFH